MAQSSLAMPGSSFRRFLSFAQRVPDGGFSEGQASEAPCLELRTPKIGVSGVMIGRCDVWGRSCIVACRYRPVQRFQTAHMEVPLLATATAIAHGKSLIPRKLAFSPAQPLQLAAGRRVDQARHVAQGRLAGRVRKTNGRTAGKKAT